MIGKSGAEVLVGQASRPARGLQAPLVVATRQKAGLETRRRPGGLPHTDAWGFIKIGGPPAHGDRCGHLPHKL
jgi:hypothetical protein